MLQGVVWGVLGCLGCLLISCKLDVPSVLSFPSVLYLLYFYDPQCATPPDISGVTWPAAMTSRSETSRVLCIAYLAAGAAWALLSLPLLVVSLCRVRGTWCLASSYLWAVAAVACLVLDVVATAAYGFTIGNDLPVLSQLETSTQDQVRAMEPLLAAVLMLVTSRGVVLWVADAVLVACVVRGAHRLRDGFDEDKVMSTAAPPDQPRGGQQPPPQHAADYHGYDPSTPPLHPHDPRLSAFRKEARMLPEVSLRRSPASSLVEEEQAAPHPQLLQRPFTYAPQPHLQPQQPHLQRPASYTEQPQPQQLQRPTSYTQQPQPQPQPQQVAPPYTQQPQKALQLRPQVAAEDNGKKRRDKEKDKDKRRGKENVQVRREDLPGFSILPLKKGFEHAPVAAPEPDSEPEDEGYLRGNTARRNFQRRLEHQLEQPRRISPVVSLEDYARRDDPRGAQQRLPPEQLRSLLPWSYLAPPEELLRRPTRGTEEDAGLEMPPVPVPDYTLHFGQRQRDPLPSDSPASSSPGQTRAPPRNGGLRRQEVLY